MKPRVIIVCPYRGTNQYRRRNFIRAHDQMLRVAQSWGYEVWVNDGQPTTEPFSVARAVNGAAVIADAYGRKPWDILVRWGADCVLDRIGSLREAVSKVEWHAKAFDQTTVQSQEEWNRNEIVFRQTGNMCYGGIEVFTRDAWAGVGGYDTRFIGYGAEDYALVHGLELVHGQQRNVFMPGNMVLLWHPRHKRNARAAADPFWQRRPFNLELFNRDIKPIETNADWQRHLTTRYANGFENPYWTGAKQ